MHHPYTALRAPSYIEPWAAWAGAPAAAHTEPSENVKTNDDNLVSTHIKNTYIQIQGLADTSIAQHHTGIHLLGWWGHGS